MPVPTRDDAAVADTIASAFREMTALTADLERLQGHADAPQGVRDECERLALISGLYARRLGELLPVLRERHA